MILQSSVIMLDLHQIPSRSAVAWVLKTTRPGPSSRRQACVLSPAIAAVEQAYRRLVIALPECDRARQAVLDDVLAKLAQLVRRHEREKLGSGMDGENVAPAHRAAPLSRVARNPASERYTPRNMLGGTVPK